MNSYKNSQPAPPIMSSSPPPVDQRVPPIDWDRPPWNRWAFQRMSQILRTAPIYKDRTDKVLNPLDTNPVDISKIQFELEDAAISTIDQFIEDSYTDGLVVMHNNKIVHESYYNCMQPHTLHLGPSVSKSIVATAAASLFEQRLIDVAAPITEYLPELSETAWKVATVQHKQPYRAQTVLTSHCHPNQYEEE